MIRIRIFNVHPKHRVNNRALVNLSRKVFKGEETTQAECNIVVLDDKRMIAMNGGYLNHWYVTDVLAFPLHESTEQGIEGEVYVNVDQARRQAREYGVTLKNELARLVIHGVLHIIGYRDSTKIQKARMSRLEDKYLTLLK